MAIYILRRLLLMIPTLFGVMAVTFLVIQFVPGGPVERMVSLMEKGHNNGSGEVAASVQTGSYRGSKGLDPEQLAQLRHLYGFDKPPIERFLSMMWNYLRFDFGDSYYYHRSVVDLVVEKLPVSISLGIWSFLLTYLVSIPLGIR